MKFTNGQWILEQGYELFSPKEVYFEKVVNNTLVLTTTTKPIEKRGDTLGGVNLTLEIATPFPEIIKVKCYHYKGIVNKGPSFELNQQEGVLDYKSNDQVITVRSGSLSLVINKKSFSMSYYRHKECLTQSVKNDFGYVKADWQGLPYDKPTKENSFMHQNLSLAVNEYVYGLGERFTPFVRNGQVVDIWNEDGGTSTYQSYKNIPFYITNRGYGVFVNHPEKVSFEVGSENVEKVGFSVQGESLDYYVINGPSMNAVIQRYTALTGRPTLPKPWTFGLWLSTSFTTSYDENTVMSFIHGMIERDIPLKVFHFDCFWMKDFHWTDFVWDERVFKNPKELIRKIHRLGIKVCVWINPYIAQDSVLFDEGMEHGYFIKRENGDVWQWDMWQPGMAIVDFTHPEAVTWYQSKLASLMDMGVDTFKTDFGERIPTDVMYHDGSNPDKMHNFYTYVYNKAVYELIQKKKGKDDAVVFARSATVGGQKFPVHWGGDCWSNYASMAESLRGGLSLMMTGFGFWSHDIGGFEDTSTADVYKRWCAFGLLSSHSRLHGSTSYRIPWLYDEEAVDVLRYFTKLKAKLMPYVYGISVVASDQGIPTMRAMVLEFTEDKNTYYLDKQYMLGDALLVAPVLNDQNIGEYYLPEGQWTKFVTKEVLSGNRWVTEQYDYFGLPLLVREHTILPIGFKDDDCAYEYEDHVNLQIYALKDNQVAMRTVYGQDGKQKLHVEMIKQNGHIQVTVNASKPYQLSFINAEISHPTMKVLHQQGHSMIDITSFGEREVMTFDVKSL